MQLLSHPFSVAMREWELHYSNPSIWFGNPAPGKARDKVLTDTARSPAVELVASAKTLGLTRVCPVHWKQLHDVAKSSPTWAQVDLERCTAKVDGKTGRGLSRYRQRVTLLKSLPRSLDGPDISRLLLKR